MIQLTFVFLFYLPTLSQATNYYSLPLQRDSDFSEYFATIYIGNPPQAQSVIIDNYHELLLLNCKDCLSCHISQRHQAYNFNLSTTSKQIQCKDQVPSCSNYCSKRQSSEKCKVDQKDYFGIYSMKIVSDQIRLSKSLQQIATKPYYGCIVSENLQRKYKENGILGVQFSQNNIFNTIFQLSRNEYVQQVGLCLAKQKGFLQLGVIPNVEKQNYVSLPMAGNNLYGIGGVQDILFGETSIKIDYSLRKGIHVMTRSPFSFIPGRAFDLVKSKLKQICMNDTCEVQKVWQQHHQQNMTCLSFAEYIDVDSYFPQLQFRFEGYNVGWKASEYLIEGIPSNSSKIIGEQYGYYCLTFMNNSDIDKYVWGLNFLQKKHIIFDVPSSTILIQDNFDCSLRLAASVSSPHYLIYSLFVVIVIFLFGGSYIKKVLKKCIVKRKPKDQLVEQGASNLDQMGKSLPEIK